MNYLEEPEREALPRGEAKECANRVHSFCFTLPFIPYHEEVVSQLLFCHPELVSGSHKFLILLDAELGSA